jgi:hypothetical protein
MTATAETGRLGSMVCLMWEMHKISAGHSGAVRSWEQGDT